MNTWLYTASDARACVADTRAITLKHRLLWHGGEINTQLERGDLMLLAFRLPQGALAALATFALDDAAHRLNVQLERLPPRSRCYGEGVFDTIWDDFAGARPGRNRGLGFQATRRRVLALRVHDELDDLWRGWRSVYDAPLASHFELVGAGGGSEVLSPLMNPRFQGPASTRLASIFSTTP
jgi:hypothetical protein